jgi:hypothetical protein
MTLRAWLQSSGGQFGPGASTLSLPEEPRCKRKAAEVERQHAMVGVAAEPPDIDAIAARLRETLTRQGAAAIPRRDLKYAPHCLWAGEAPIAEHDPETAKKLVEAIAERGRRSLISTLAVTYMRFYGPERPGVGFVGRALRDLAPKAGPAIAGLQRHLDLFDPTNGPDHLASDAVNRGGTPADVLREYGLSGDVLTSGLAAEAARRGMAQLRERLEREESPALVQTADWWAYDDGVIRFQGAAAELARTLVRPFIDQTPEPDLRQEILNTLLDRLHDPRLHPQKWLQVEEERDQVRRWLAGESLRQFLDIVDRVAMPEHWVYRRAFWKAFYDAGLMEEAWVAFGHEGEREALRVFGRQASFGRLSASGKAVERGHAVLLMKIGSLTICDWSHNGRCIIWPKGHQHAPPLYKGRYYSGDLAPRGEPQGGIAVRHDGSDSYNWQRRISGFIRDKIGTSVSDRDFQVRRR